MLLNYSSTVAFRTLPSSLCSAQTFKENVAEYTSCFALARSPCTLLGFLFWRWLHDGLFGLCGSERIGELSTPSLPQPVKFPGCKLHPLTHKQSVSRAYNNSNFNIVLFNESPKKKTKQKVLRISNFSHFRRLFSRDSIAVKWLISTRSPLSPVPSNPYVAFVEVKHHEKNICPPPPPPHTHTPFLLISSPS